MGELTPNNSRFTFFEKNFKKTVDKKKQAPYNTQLIGSLAQSVEQRTFNPLVERSNRSRPTKYKKPALKKAGFLYSLSSLSSLDTFLIIEIKQYPSFVTMLL